MTTTHQVLPNEIWVATFENVGVNFSRHEWMNKLLFFFNFGVSKVRFCWLLQIVSQPAKFLAAQSQWPDARARVMWSSALSFFGFCENWVRVPPNPSNSTASSSLFIKVAIHKMGIPHLQTLLECFFGTEECWREKHQDIGRKNFQPRPSCHFNQSLKYLHKIDNISSQYIYILYRVKKARPQDCWKEESSEDSGLGIHPFQKGQLLRSVSKSSHSVKGSVTIMVSIQKWCRGTLW